MSLQDHHDRLEAARKRAEEIAAQRHWGTIRLLTFVGAVIFGLAGSSALYQGLALGCVALFVGAVVMDLRGAMAVRKIEALIGIHERHIARGMCQLSELPVAGDAIAGHPYARDLDLVGPGSLAQRIDTTRTVIGGATLSMWLGAGADLPRIHARQEAVKELAEAIDFRVALESAAAQVKGEGKIDVAPFMQFVERAPIVSPLFLLGGAALCLTTFGLFLAHLFVNPGWLIPLVIVAGIQVLVALQISRVAIPVFQLVAARQGYLEAISGMLQEVERFSPESAELKRLRAQIHIGDAPPSRYLGALSTYASLAEFHTQFPLHFVLNLATFYDLYVLFLLERWAKKTGAGLDAALSALGQIEALGSLSVLLDVDPGATMPAMAEDAPIFDAQALGHPLLPVDRVTNDVHLQAPGDCWIITGSNMAGKSTLLRAVGLNIALAQAGGPVIAEALTLRPVRLRASMRVDDSLGEGASYFQAELHKLQSVVEGAQDPAQPPIFFLLDELLRGTNARARHIGARSILTHLLDRGAAGLTATHDIALSTLEEERDGVRNLHFTDVMIEGEMSFDYRLREGVVKTSNALRLLEMVGIEVPVDDLLPTTQERSIGAQVPRDVEPEQE